MGDLNLTGEERNLVQRLAHEREGLGYRLGFYASVVVPMLLLALYGLVKVDFIAEVIAFAGLMAFFIWRVSAEMSRLKVFRSLFQKLVEHERKVADPSVEEQ